MLMKNRIGIAAGLLCAAAFTPAFGAAPLPAFNAGAWGLDTPSDPTQFSKVPGDTGPGPILQHPDYPYNNDSRRGTRRIADTSNPILRPWVKEIMDTEVKRVMAGMKTGESSGISFVPASRCWPGGVPGIHLYTGNVTYWQKPNVTYIFQERDNVRHVWMNQAHSKDPGYSWYGESVGHMEGPDTLVIDTIGLDDRGPIDRETTPHSRQLHVVEHEKIVMKDGKPRMNITIDIDDPVVFTMPFKAYTEYEHIANAKYDEYICNENGDDYWIPYGNMVPSPRGVKLDF